MNVRLSMTICFSELVLTIMMAVLMTACGNNSSKPQQYNRLTQSDSTHIDSVVASYMRDHIETVIDPGDTVTIDTSTPEAQLRFIKKQFDYEYSPAGSMYDTLVDVNYDGYKDYVIGFYAGSGTGIKNGAVVYTYQLAQKKYLEDTVLSYKPNPTFYISQKKITYFYLANGGGQGGRLTYQHGKWIEAIHFDVDNKESESAWDISYPVSGKKKTMRRPYQMVPPEDILETGVTQDNYHPFL